MMSCKQRNKRMNKNPKNNEKWNHQSKLIFSGALSSFFWSSLTIYKWHTSFKVYNVSERVVEEDRVASKGE